MVGLKQLNHVADGCVSDETKQDISLEARFLWLDHIAHLEENKLPKIQVQDGFKARRGAWGNMKRLLVQESLMSRGRLEDQTYKTGEVLKGDEKFL